MVEMFCSINGQVQGVMYRTYAQEAATNLGLIGWVKNKDNGTVEVVAQGTPDVLKEFVEYLHEGSSLSKVDSVSVDWRTASKHYDEFSILY